MSGDEAGTQVRLSRRQHEVLLGISYGLTNADIGRALHLSPNTIKVHVRRLLEVLKAGDRAHAVRRGVETGVLRIYLPASPFPGGHHG